MQQKIKQFVEFEMELSEGYFDLEDRDYVMYHATPTKNVESILKTGLRPSLPSNRQYSEGLGWLSDDMGIAKAHAISRMKKKGIQDTVSVIVFKMNPRVDKLFKSLAHGIYTVREIIPPEKIVKVISP